MKKSSVVKSLLASVAVLGFVGLSNEVKADEIIIQSGDTLSKLAESHNTTVNDLVQINQISNPDLIYAGEHLFTSWNDVNHTPVQTEQVVEQPVQTEVPVVQETAPQETTQVVEQPVQESPATYSAPATTSSAKEWIAMKE